MARTRMSRHELKSQDEITSTIQRFTEAAYARKKEIVAALVAVLVLAAAIVGWRVYAANRDARAQSELSEAIALFNDRTNNPVDKDRYEKAMAAAQKTYDEFPSSIAAPIAQYYIAMSKEGLGDTAGAVQILQEIASSGDEGVRAVAQFALGGIHKKHGEVQKAIDAYKTLYDNGGYSKSAVMMELAKLHETNQQTDQAKDYYQKIVTDFPESPFRAEADQALRRLGVTVPPPAAGNPS